MRHQSGDRSQLRATVRLTAAVVLTSALAVGCSSHDGAPGAPAPKPSVSSTAASDPASPPPAARQSDPRDADLTVAAQGACTFELASHGATQKLHLTGKVKTPVQAAVVFTVSEPSGTSVSESMQVVRLEAPGRVDQEVTVTTQMARQDWQSGANVCSTHLLWTPLADR